MASRFSSPSKVVLLLGAGVLWLGCTGEDAPAAPTSNTGASLSQLCDELCRKTMAACTTGANLIYRSVEQCVQTCNKLEPGLEGTTTGNTIRCRIAEVNAGNCNGAGPLGGGKCGRVCDGFCRVSAASCKELNPFTSEGTCVETCEGQIAFDPAAPQGAEQPFNGRNTLNCRAQHLLLTFTEPGTRCAHLGVQSPPCSAP